MYCTRCYAQSHRKLLPFNFCKDCWVKAGKPTVMKSEAYITEEEPANQQGCRDG